MKSAKSFFVITAVFAVINFSFTYAAEWTDMSGKVAMEDGTPLCAMVLANGQHIFSCDPIGNYNLHVPLDSNGQITLFAFCDGFLPFKKIMIPEEAANFDIVISPVPSESGEMTILKTVDVRQATSYTCGAACAQVILSYYGIDQREDRIAEQFGTTEDSGTSPDQLIAGFESYGLTAAMKEDTTLEYLSVNLQNKIPTMVAVQAWLETYPPSDWNQNWEDGHWVIVIGMDEDNIYFEDPSLLGTRGWMTQEEFLERWHDYIGDYPCCDEDDQPVNQLSISVTGQSVNFEPYTHID